MGKIHTVKQGECLSSIAYQYGFARYQAIYGHQDNAEFRKKRPDPNVLYPGDEIEIPDRTEKTLTFPLDQRHRIVIKRPTVKLRLALRDPAGKTAAGCRFRLVVGSLDKQGTVPSDGVIDEPVPIGESSGTVWVYWGDAGYQPAPVRLTVGHLDPVETAKGYQARLTNLGYRQGPFAGRPGRRTRAALQAFQQQESLEVTGSADEATCQQLAKRHDQVG